MRRTIERSVSDRGTLWQNGETRVRETSMRSTSDRSSDYIREGLQPCNGPPIGSVELLFLPNSRYCAKQPELAIIIVIACCQGAYSICTAASFRKCYHTCYHIQATARYTSLPIKVSEVSTSVPHYLSTGTPLSNDGAKNFQDRRSSPRHLLISWLWISIQGC